MRHGTFPRIGKNSCSGRFWKYDLLTRFAGSLSRRSTGSKSVIGELAIKLHRVAKDRRQHTLACNRESHCRDEAAVFPVREHNVAAMRPEPGARGGEAQAYPSRFTIARLLDATKRCEDVLERLPRDTGALVGNGDDD